MGNNCCGMREPSGAPEDLALRPPAYSQAGGHDNTIAFLGDRIEKCTKHAEAAVYQQIFDDQKTTSLTQLRPFVPYFYGAEQKLGDPYKWLITTQNLLYGLEKGSFVDIKLGTSTLTDQSGLIKTAKCNIIDQMTTAHLYGFRICGMTIKDPRDGSLIYKYGKTDCPRDLPEAEEFMKNFFDSGLGVPDRTIVKGITNQLKQMEKYFKEVNQHEIRGMSLFIAIDQHKREYCCKLIDLCSFKEIGQQDEGIVKGIGSLLIILKKLKERSLLQGRTYSSLKQIKSSGEI